MTVVGSLSLIKNYVVSRAGHKGDVVKCGLRSLRYQGNCQLSTLLSALSMLLLLRYSLITVSLVFDVLLRLENILFAKYLVLINT